MGKRRKTRQEKIILQLKRRLASQGREKVSASTKFQPRQEAIYHKPQAKTEEKLSLKKSDNMTFSFDPRLVKRDILKTLILSLAIISLQIVLYLKLR